MKCSKLTIKTQDVSKQLNASCDNDHQLWGCNANQKFLKYSNYATKVSLFGVEDFGQFRQLFCDMYDGNVLQYWSC